MKSAPCTVFRPDENGNLVAVEIARPVRKPAVVRRGPFVVWDDQCQATRVGDTLEACAEYVCGGQYEEGREEVVYLSARGPQRLNAEEERALRALIKEGSE